jgi:hypothetical protein
VNWTNAGVANVEYKRNEYTGTLRVVETKADANAP